MLPSNKLSPNVEKSTKKNNKLKMTFPLSRNDKTKQFVIDFKAKKNFDMLFKLKLPEDKYIKRITLVIRITLKTSDAV